MSRAVSGTGMSFALVLAVVLAASPASASAAATHTFQVISATESYSTTATQGCVSGRRDYTSSATGTVPDDPGNAFTPGPGQIGSISTRSSTTDTSPTTGQFFNDYIDNSCSMPPCHYDYGVTASERRLDRDADIRHRRPGDGENLDGHRAA